jgi:hypothetical protein
MPKLLTDAQAVLIYHKLAIARFCLFLFLALGTAVLGAFQGIDWATCDGQTKFTVIVAILVNACTTISAFLDKTASRVAKGEDPLAPDGTTNPPIPTK